MNSDTAREFLQELANLLDDPGALSRFEAHYHEFYMCERVVTLARHWAMNIEEDGYDPARGDAAMVREHWLIPLRNHLRGIWRSSSLDGKQFGLFKMREDFFLQGESGLMHAPMGRSSDFFVTTLLPPTDCEKCIMKLIGWAHLTHICANGECIAPYYVAKRRSQKYCGEKCGQPSQAQYKRQWWAAHGNEWRAKRNRTEGARENIR